MDRKAREINANTTRETWQGFVEMGCLSWIIKDESGALGWGVPWAESTSREQSNTQGGPLIKYRYTLDNETFYGLCN